MDQARAVAGQDRRASTSRGDRAPLHPLQRLQTQAGNRAVTALVVQREPPGAAATGAAAAAPPAQAAAPIPPGTVTATAQEVTPPAAAPPATPATGGTAPAAGPPPAQRQFQVQYAYQGGATQATGQAPGQTNSWGSGHQLTVQMNVSHHDDQHAGREESYGVQAGFDPAFNPTGVTGQAQEALVSATRHHLQGQIFANVGGGAAADPGGTIRPVVQGGLGAQGSVVINDHFTVFVQAQDQGSVYFGGPHGATATNSVQATGGVTFTF